MVALASSAFWLPNWRTFPGKLRFNMTCLLFSYVNIYARGKRNAKLHVDVKLNSLWQSLALVTQNLTSNLVEIWSSKRIRTVTKMLSYRRKLNPRLKTNEHLKLFLFAFYLIFTRYLWQIVTKKIFVVKDNKQNMSAKVRLSDVGGIWAEFRDCWEIDSWKSYADIYV